jgi:signal transduction histidine kinase
MSATRILIVEDEAILAADLGHILERMGHEVAATAATGEEALRLVAQSMPGLVLMDINIRGQLDGIETACRLRECSDPPPLIFLTSYSDAETVARASVAEPSGYLLKPFDEPLLAITIEMALYKHRMERERERLRRELEKAQAELQRSNRDLDQFAYVASHDLQEPLRMVASYLELIARRYKDKLDAQGEQFIGFAVDGAMRMRTLIRDLLAFSRIGSDEKAPVPVDMSAAVRTAMEDLKVAIAEKHATVTYEPLPTIPGHPSLLVRLFQNLIGNATKFCTEAAPRVHISGRHEGGEWIFSVADNGIGIESEYRDQIFVIFKRLHGREQYPGTGLGLALCKRIVEHHGGRIWMDSERGKGSTFSFALPAPGEPTAPAPAQSNAGGARQASA